MKSEPASTRADGPGGPLLRIEALKSGYGHVPVLHGVDLHVDAGEIVTLVGANGSGKSTLLKTIVGLVQVRSGSVFFDGEDISRTTPERAVRSGIALVPEGRMLFGPLTVDENLRLGAFSRSDGAEPVAADLERVFELFPVLRVASSRCWRWEGRSCPARGSCSSTSRRSDSLRR
jgi:branched-chain amino acid transport system ATP-binding protein